ncbi:MAG: DoxX-like family protein [Verrucomicrobiota bacterium]
MKTKIQDVNQVVMLWNLKVVCRWALGLVWVWEGLVPKILWTSEVQTELVRHSGMYWPDPDGWLVILGLAMIVAGIIICSGWMERLAVAVATVTVMILVVLVVGNHPSSLSDLHGGIAKDLCLFACAWVVWKLAPLVPHRVDAG